MGRLRTKDHDLAPGWRRIKGKLYFQPTSASERDARRQRAFTLPEGELVYFIRSKAGAVKIGYTSSKSALEGRLRMLRVGSPAPLTLIGAIAGTRADERKAHADLKLWRRNGEWFGPCRAVSAYVRQALMAGALPKELSNSEKIEELPV